jgi:hypothetical protein
VLNLLSQQSAVNTDILYCCHIDQFPLITDNFRLSSVKIQKATEIWQFGEILVSFGFHLDRFYCIYMLVSMDISP